MASVNAPRASVLEARTLIATYESPEYATAISRSALLRRLDAQLADLDAELTAGRESMAAAWSAARTRVALAGLAALLLVGALAVSTSHRFVGPLARIRSDLESLAAGERIAPVKLRKHDEFGELAAAVEALRQRLEAESGGS
jgi:HAMP domain-containing protein